MDLGLSEEQELLKGFVRDFLEKECPETRVREMEEDERGYKPEFWRMMAAQGWQGMIIPQQYGGTGMTFTDLIVLLEEFGRALVPGPFISTVVLGAIPILQAGTEEQKQAFLPKIAAGELIMTLALTEPSARWDADGVAMPARAEGDSFVLSGTKLFVPDAHVSDCMLVAARTKESANPEDGITLFLVDSKSAGIQFTALKTIAADKQCEVAFNEVRVPKANVLGEVDKGWPIIRGVKSKAAVAACAYMVGLAQMDFDITLEYAKQRIQFGRPIGSFQAIQHKFADMIIDVDGSRFITYKAAWALQENEPDAEMLVSMAKAWCNEAARRVVAHGQQIHGGIGFTKDYKIELYFRRQKWMELMWGDADYHRELVADKLAI
ncbi:MAG: acyl-CoA/acyl-ACP dehydrogenase [Dehalococcoidia bacterium]|nr:acyl-CoA/acyl-ACP dehydrogenase [Dehalococcoidia bacterium]